MPYAPYHKYDRYGQYKRYHDYRDYRYRSYGRDRYVNDNRLRYDRDRRYSYEYKRDNDYKYSRNQGYKERDHESARSDDRSRCRQRSHSLERVSSPQKRRRSTGDYGQSPASGAEQAVEKVFRAIRFAGLAPHIEERDITAYVLRFGACECVFRDDPFWIVTFPSEKARDQALSKMAGDIGGIGGKRVKPVDLYEDEMERMKRLHPAARTPVLRGSGDHDAQS